MRIRKVALWSALCVAMLAGLSLSCLLIASNSAKPAASAMPDLLAGASWKYSIDGGETFSPTMPVLDTTRGAKVLARIEFDVKAPGDYVAMELTHGIPVGQQVQWKLNGNPLNLPMDKMFYRTVPGINATALLPGRNVLTADITHKNAWVKVSLLGVRPSDVKLNIGPIMGAFDEKNFSFVCRTNVPVELTAVPQTGTPLRAVGVWAASSPAGNPATIPASNTTTALATSPATSQAAADEGLIHRFNVPLSGGEYSIMVGKKVLAKVKSPPLPPEGELRFAAMGDSRSNPDLWASVAMAAFKTKPNMVVFTGDMVSNGKDDELWNEEFFHPGRRLLSTVPFYPVFGNHEANAPILDELFYVPGPEGRGKNWSQTIEGVLFIGIDGGENWLPDGLNTKWLEKTLKESKAKFIFLATHYPPWTSSTHGTIGPNGKPSEKTIRQGQDVIMPLLEKYHATAVIAGHDHCYERSEPAGGVSIIIAGGAGAPLYAKAVDAEKQNPYSKVYAKELNYCVFEIKGDTASMKAFTPEGRELDATQWKARRQD